MAVPFIIPPGGNTTNQLLRINLEMLAALNKSVTAKSTTSTTTTSTSYVDTALSASIFPISPSNRVKITVSSAAGIAASGERVIFTLERNGTDLEGSAGMSDMQVTGAGPVYAPMSFTYVDSPATTEQVTYVLRVKSAGGGTVYDNPNGTTAFMLLEEIV